MTTISIEGVSRSFGTLAAVRSVSLTVENGELFTLLGPSGCGKTTLLRMIAGFCDLDSGTIRFDGEPIDRLPPHRRNIGMVFQNFAVFPNLTAAGNVAYGLRARGIAAAEIERRVAQALRLVHLDGMSERWPHQLSGGQLQRVAIARAVVIEPRVLLLDEPLSNLDAKLRVEMRGEIRGLVKSLAITAVYVTHDQEEALAMSDRIAVMRAGVIEQVAPPAVIYRHPATVFVAEFMGTTNLLAGVVRRHEGEIVIVSASGHEFAIANRRPLGAALQFSLRPEALRLIDARDAVPAEWHRLSARLGRIELLGALARFEAVVGDGLRLQVAVLDAPLEALTQGSDITLAYDPRRVTVFATP
ncbi:MAG TPA: ABC transporter ATP-binding protein [Stellaceae bacterium]|nr:ABC transporter ATP-binding protein [Stellaceae bacterium]